MRKNTVNAKERKEGRGCPGTKASVEETRLEQVFLRRPWKSHTEADIHVAASGGLRTGEVEMSWRNHSLWRILTGAGLS